MSIQGAEFKADCWYDVDAIRKALGLSVKAIGNACRASELRFVDRCGKRLFRGQWIIDWLEAGVRSESEAPR